MGVQGGWVWGHRWDGFRAQGRWVWGCRMDRFGGTGGTDFGAQDRAGFRGHRRSDRRKVTLGATGTEDLGAEGDIGATAGLAGLGTQALAWRGQGTRPRGRT